VLEVRESDVDRELAAARLGLGCSLCGCCRVPSEAKEAPRALRAGFSVLPDSTDRGAILRHLAAVCRLRRRHDPLVTVTSKDLQAGPHLAFSLLMVAEHAAESVLTFPSTC